MTERAVDLRRQILALVREYHDATVREAPPFVPGDSLVRYAGRVFDHDELTHLVDASLDFWLTDGRYCSQFETELAALIDVPVALLVNSGSSANLVAMSSLTSKALKDRRLRPGDEVITVAAGFPTTVNPILQNQLVPVFTDVSLGTYVPTIESIERAVGPRTRAVMIAHTMGVPFPVAEVAELCRRKAMWLVEDNCDALMSRYDGRPTGTFGDLATFSFYPAHHVTTGEGGAVVAKNETLARIARSFRDWGRDCHCRSGKNNSCGKRFSQQFGSLPVGYDHKYVYSHVGYNLKVTEMQAAIGVAQLKKIEAFTAARKRNHARLHRVFEARAEVVMPHAATPRSDPSWFGYVATVRPDSGLTRTSVLRSLTRSQVETRNLFCGNLLRHPAYEGIPHRLAEPLVNTEVITDGTFFVGVYPGMTDAMMEQLETAVEEALNPAAHDATRRITL